MSLPLPNTNKQLTLKLHDATVNRYPIKTKVITSNDNLPLLVMSYCENILPFLSGKPIIVLSEKAVACSQNRAIPVEKIKVSKLAYFLSNYVTKTPIGIGLGMPQTMQLALNECGIPRIILASIFSIMTKFCGIKGVFYLVAGQKARSIDGPANYVIPPFNKCAVMGALNANSVCNKISTLIQDIPVAIIDANDYGRNIIGNSNNVNKSLKKIITDSFIDNPLGSSRKQTPIAVLEITYIPI